jgi:hypothetical protein
MNFTTLNRKNIMNNYAGLLLLIVIYSVTGCCPKTTRSTLASSNVLFPAGTNTSQRGVIIDQIKSEILNDIAAYNALHNKNVTVSFEVDTCKCDSLLVNINARATHGVGESVATTTRTTSRATGNGWTIVAKNMQFQTERFTEDDKKRANIDTGNKVLIGQKKVDDSYVLAVIDSGIDPGVFPPVMNQILWQPPAGTLSMKNFIKGANINNNFDDHVGKHGSVVTAMVLKSMANSQVYPRLMVLKALDQFGNGSTFNVSCALSYARQQGANAINLSLGYIGEPDSVLYHYTSLRHLRGNNAVPVIAAAGNTESVHDLSKICLSTVNGSNQLLPTYQFFPASFTLPNVISVTGLADTTMPCFYQNYSNNFIKLGVINSPSNPCCAFKIEFFPNWVREGSSFVAPVISGKVIDFIINNGMKNNPADYFTGLSVSSSPLNTFTNNGSFILYGP